MSKWVKVAEVGELESGDRKVVEVDGLFVAVFQVSDNYYAIEDVCTHDDGPLGDGELDDYEVECPRHGARFDIRTGEALSFPAITPVPRFEVKIEGSDILIDLEGN